MSAELETGVIVCSDTTDFITDTVGQHLIDLCESRGWKVLAYSVIPKDLLVICDTIKRVVEDPYVDVLFTVGGTGCQSRDCMTEVMHEVTDGTASSTAAVLTSRLDQVLPGHALRVTARRRDKTIIVNMPDSSQFIDIAFDAIAESVLAEFNAGVVR